MRHDHGFVGFVCPSCNTEIEASLDMVGQKTECPACSAMIIVPEPPPQVDDGVVRHGADEGMAPNVTGAAKSRTIRIELGDIGL